MTITGGTRVGNVLIETDGTTAPAEVGKLYKSTVEALRLFAKDVAIGEPVDEIVAVPAAAMCEPTAYPDHQPPKDCATAQSVTTFGPTGARRLMIVSDRTRLIPAMRRGVAQAACLFAAQDDQQVKRICDVTTRFADSAN